MGIRSLNKFLQTRCKNLFPKSLECLRDQTIAIDAHNYLYQIINGDLLINVSDACNVFKKYNIHTIWVFDGYPPEHKKDIIKKRKNYFRTLHSKHNILMQIKSDSVSTKLNKSIDMLEKKMRKLTSNDIAQVKKYLEDNKYEYVVTNNGIEADIVCVELVKGNKANAVLSEDMDIIGMGCPMTIRKFNKTHEKCIYYIMDNIIDDLDITIDSFKRMCTLVSKKVTVEKAFELLK